eukprot:3574150-Amphidinium_carterae.1
MSCSTMAEGVGFERVNIKNHSTQGTGKLLRDEHFPERASSIRTRSEAPRQRRTLDQWSGGEARQRNQQTATPHGLSEHEATHLFSRKP